MAVDLISIISNSGILMKNEDLERGTRLRAENASKKLYNELREEEKTLINASACIKHF